MFYHVLEKYTPLQAPDPCHIHPPHVQSFFCDDCKERICILCKIRGHSSHVVVTVSDKHKELQEQLKRATRSNSRKSISRRLDGLKNGRKVVENDAEKVKEKILFQHNSVKQWLSEIYEHQISVLNNAMNEELCRFDNEENKLKDLMDIKNLLRSSDTNNIEELISAQQKVSTKVGTIWRKPTYIEPRKETFVPSEEMFAFLQIHILGYCVFQSVENADIGEPQSGFFPASTKLMRSHSLVEIPSVTFTNKTVAEVKPLPWSTEKTRDIIQQPTKSIPNASEEVKKDENKVLYVTSI